MPPLRTDPDRQARQNPLKEEHETQPLPTEPWQQRPPLHMPDRHWLLALQRAAAPSFGEHVMPLT